MRLCEFKGKVTKENLKLTSLFALITCQAHIVWYRYRIFPLSQNVLLDSTIKLETLALLASPPTTQGKAEENRTPLDPIALVLKLQHASESLGELVKMQFAGPHPQGF